VCVPKILQRETTQNVVNNVVVVVGTDGW